MLLSVGGNMRIYISARRLVRPILGPLSSPHKAIVQLLECYNRQINNEDKMAVVSLFSSGSFVRRIDVVSTEGGQQVLNASPYLIQSIFQLKPIFNTSACLIQ